MGRKNLGGGPTQSPLFANIFARLKANICPKEADFLKIFPKLGGYRTLMCQEERQSK